MEGIIWIILIILCIVINGLTSMPFMICFAGGALISFILTYLTNSFILEVAIFIITSFLFIIAFLKFRGPVPRKTNCDFLIGQLVIVTDTINRNEGRVYINEMHWQARPKWKSEIFEKGEIVKIAGIQGTKLLVMHRLEEE